MSFFLGSAARRAASPFGISMLGVGRAAPAQFPAAGREFTAHSRRRPEGRLGGYPMFLLSNCDPLRWARSWRAALRAAVRKRHIACGELFHFIAKLIARSLKLLLASKPDPLSLGSGLGTPPSGKAL